MTGGTRVLSDWLIVRVSADPGEGFLDRMISLVEGAKRQKTPNEIALNILLAGFTIIFLVVCATLLPYSLYSVERRRPGHADHDHGADRAAGLPDPDDHRRPALGHRHRRHGPHDPAQRDRHVGPGGGSRRRRGCAAARQDRHDHARQPPGRGVHPGERRRSSSDLAEAAQLASLADETPEGRSIVVLAKEKYGLRGRTMGAATEAPDGMHFVPFTAQTRMSGVDLDGTSHSQGRARHDAEPTSSDRSDGAVRPEASGGRDRPHGRHAAGRGRNGEALGVIHLKDIVKGGIKERFAHLRQDGHQDGDDHRRQPAHGRRHRRRGRRG